MSSAGGGDNGVSGLLPHNGGTPSYAAGLRPSAAVSGAQQAGGLGVSEPSRSSRESHSSGDSHMSTTQIGHAANALEPPSTNGAGGGGNSSQSGARLPHLFGHASFRVSVADTGPGIPLMHQAAIFSTYKQVQSARIQQGRGTGLGLQISRSIIELHRGKIGFLTQEGKGSEFYFVLPLPVMSVSIEEKLNGEYADIDMGDDVPGGDGGRSGRLTVPEREVGGTTTAAEPATKQHVGYQPQLLSIPGCAVGGGCGAISSLHAVGGGGSGGGGGDRYCGGRVSHHTRSAVSDTELVSVQFHADDFDVALAVYADIKENEKDDDDEHDDAANPDNEEQDRASPQREDTKLVNYKAPEDSIPPAAASLRPRWRNLPLPAINQASVGAAGGSASIHDLRSNKAAAASSAAKPRVLVVEGQCSACAMCRVPACYMCGVSSLLTSFFLAILLLISACVWCCGFLRLCS